MENTAALVRAKLNSSERKIINLGVDGLASENSRRAYQIGKSFYNANMNDDFYKITVSVFDKRTTA